MKMKSPASLQKQVYNIFLALTFSIIGTAYWIGTIGDGAPGLADAGGKFDTVMRLYTPLTSQQVGTIGTAGLLGLMVVSLLILIRAKGLIHYLPLLWLVFFILQFFNPFFNAILLIVSVLTLIAALISIMKITDQKFLQTLFYLISLSILGIFIEAISLMVWGFGIWNNAPHIQYTWLNTNWIISLLIAFVLMGIPEMFAFKSFFEGIHLIKNKL